MICHGFCEIRDGTDNGADACLTLTGISYNPHVLADTTKHESVSSQPSALRLTLKNLKLKTFI